LPLPGDQGKCGIPIRPARAWSGRRGARWC
jgi:hypothetical protein